MSAYTICPRCNDESLDVVGRGLTSGKDSMRKPTPEDRERGLYGKYVILHADGSPTDLNAKYFVLRLDYHEGCDDDHVYACRAATARYAEMIRNHLPALADDLYRLLLSPSVSPNAGGQSRREAAYSAPLGSPSSSEGQA